jgi:hypothetical protein
MYYGSYLHLKFFTLYLQSRRSRFCSGTYVLIRTQPVETSYTATRYSHGTVRQFVAQRTELCARTILLHSVQYCSAQEQLLLRETGHSLGVRGAMGGITTGGSHREGGRTSTGERTIRPACSKRTRCVGSFQRHDVLAIPFAK